MLSKLKALLTAAALLSPVAGFAQASITAGRIGTAPVDVTKPEASPRFFLNIAGKASQVVFQYQSPSGVPASEVFFNLDSTLNGPQPGFSGSLTFQGYSASFGGNGSVLSPYSEAGKWTLTNVSVADTSGIYTQYNGPALQAIFRSLTFTVVNSGTPDTVSPQIHTAVITTPTASIANGPYAHINMSVTDDLSGVNQLFAFATSPGGSGSLYFQNTAPFSPRTSGVFALYASVPANAQPGTYTVQSVTAYDIAGNATSITDPAAIAKLFNNHATINVTP